MTAGESCDDEIVNKMKQQEFQIFVQNMKFLLFYVNAVIF